MIPAFLIARFGEPIAKLIFWVTVAVLLIAALLIGHAVMVHNAQAGLKTEIKLDARQAEAAQASGTDAVNTLGNVEQNEQAVDATTRSNADAIDTAPGATVAVDPAVRAAGLRALCQRASYRGSHPACVQHATP